MRKQGNVILRSEATKNLLFQKVIDSSLPLRMTCHPHHDVVPEQLSVYRWQDIRKADTNSMTSRERMLAAMEGRPVDMVPIAPYFWGAEYAWKLMGINIWQLILGTRGVGDDMQKAIMDRHDCDWVLPLHEGNGWLEGKEVIKETPDRVYFRDTNSRQEYVFHMEGHWVVEVERENEARLDNEGANVEPPSNRAEADEWLKRRVPGIDHPAGEIAPSTHLRDLFPDKFLCTCMHPPFASLAYTLGFEPTLMLLNDDPSLCAYMAERLMGDTEWSCKNAAAHGFDCGLMVDSYASADIMSPQAYKDWVAPLHKITSDELHKAGLKSVMYNTGNMLPLLDTIRSLNYDAVSIEERIKGIEMDIAEVRSGIGPDQCLFANFDAYLLLDGNRDRIKAEVHRQLSGGMVDRSRFIMGTGSPVCDGSDPDALDFWISQTREASRQLSPSV